MADAVVTQSVVEVLSLPPAPARITQAVLEVLQPTAAAPPAGAEQVQVFVVLPV